MGPAPESSAPSPSIVCIRCGYDLAGLLGGAGGGVCPECGESVETSLRALESVERSVYLGRVGTGAGLAAAGAGCFILAFLLLALGGEPGVACLVIGAGIIALVLWPVGWWVAAASPVGTGLEWQLGARLTLRRAARVLAAATLLAEGGVVATIVWGRSGGGWNVMWLVAFAIIGLGLASAALWAVGFAWLAVVAGRCLRRPGLATACWVSAMLIVPGVAVEWAMAPMGVPLGTAVMLAYAGVMLVVVSRAASAARVARAGMQ